MSLFSILKYNLLMKLHKEGYLEMLFKSFVKGFDMSDKNCI